MDPTYVLVTVAKNEELFIESTIISVISQSIKPTYYVIVDDGSTDETPIIINKYAMAYPWIIYQKLLPSEWDIGVHYSYICRCGFTTALTICEKNGFQPDYIALLDADSIIETNYFKKIFEKFYVYPMLGVTSGGFYHNVDGQYIWTNTRLDFPGGTGRCWDRKCFEETGGYILDVCPDYVSTIRIRAAGWHTYKFPEILGVEQRATGFAYSNKSGNIKRGNIDYRLYLNPLLVLSKSLFLLGKQKKYSAFWYLYGYLSSLIRREKIISDSYVRHHCMVGVFGDMWKIHITRPKDADDRCLILSDDLIMDKINAQYFESMQRLNQLGSWRHEKSKK